MHMKNFMFCKQPPDANLACNADAIISQLLGSAIECA